MLSFENFQICINRINETYERLRLKEEILEQNELNFPLSGQEKIIIYKKA